MGDSRTPLMFLMISSLLNIGLDLLCILVFRMGVAGAAVATVVSQLVSGLLCLLYMMKKFEILHISKEEWRVNPGHMKMLCGMGIPMGLQYSITAIGSVILQTAVNSLGTVYVASVTAGSKLSMFFCCPFDALGSTMATYGGQNVGAGKLDRIGKGLKDCTVLGAAYSVFALGILVLFGKRLTLLFVSSGDVEIIGYAYRFLLANCTFYFPLAIVNIFRFLIQGMGFSQFAILAGVFEMAARTVTGFILVPLWGYGAACFGNAMAWIFADIFLIPAYFICMKRLRKKFRPAV